MCRIYRSKAGDYVRLCYRHGERRGEKIPFFSLPSDVSTDLLEGRICHVPKTRRVKKAEKSFNKTLWKREIPRCRKCKAPLNRANYEIGICYVCQEGK